MAEYELEDFVSSGTLPSAPDKGRESTSEDYWNTLNPIGLVYNNPTLRYSSAQDDSSTLDTQDPQFQEIYKEADRELKGEMIGARSVSHALKIAERRGIQQESLRAIGNDGIGTQLLYGAIPALASPTSLIPVAGVAGKAFQIGNTVSKIVKISKMATVGAITGATANVLDEAIIEQQGMEAHKLSAGLIGAAFGGTLGVIGGALSGPYSKTHAVAMSKEGDTFTKDFDVDPNIRTEVDENGVLQIVEMKEEYPTDVVRQKKFFTDYLPLLGKFLRSDVNTVYQSPSSVLRAEMTKLSSGTVAMKDSAGNVIPTPLNAVNDLKSADGMFMRYNKQIEESYNTAKQDEGFKGSYDDYIDEVSEIYTKAAMEQEKAVYGKIEETTKEIRDTLTAEMKAETAQVTQLYKETQKNNKTTRKALKKDLEAIDEAYRAKLDEEIRARVDKIYEDTPVEFKGRKQQVEAANKYKEYFQESLKKSQEVGIKELQGLSYNRLYRPRVWNFKKIKKMPETEVKSTIREALEAHPAQKGFNKEQMDKAVDYIYTALSNSTFDLNHLRTSWLVSKDVPFSKMLRDRKLKVDETKLGALLKDNLQDTTAAYHYKIKGRQALAKRLNIVDKESADAYMKDLRKRLQEEGNIFSEEEFKAFERTIKDITGDLRMNTLADTPEWTWVRNLSTYNSARLGGGFGGNQFIEMISNMVFNGISALTSGRLRASFRNAGELLYTKGKVDDEFTNAMVNSGFMESALHTHRVNRFSDGEQGFNSGWLENTLNGLNDKMQKLNMMRYFTAAMEDHKGGMIMEQLKTMAKKKKLSSTEVERLGRWGFTHSDTKEFAEDLAKYYSPKEGRLELDKFSPKNQQKFQQAIQNGVSEMVVQGDSLHVPNWMKTPGPMLKLLTQFMRFPLIAHEVLLRKGMQDEQAKMLAGIISSTLTYMGLKYVREQAAIQAGIIHPMDAKYDYYGYDKDEAIMRGIMGSMNYNAQLGMLANLWNIGANASGNPELGRDYASNNQLEAFMSPTFGGTAADILALTRSAANGELGSERDLMRAKSAIIMNNLPLIDEAFKAVIKEMN